MVIKALKLNVCEWRAFVKPVTYVLTYLERIIPWHVQFSLKQDIKNYKALNQYKYV